MNELNRRELLGAGMAAGATMLLGGRALAGCAPNCTPKNLIIAWANGGWDPTFTFDPKPGIEGVDTPQGRIVNYGDLPIFVDNARPGVQAFFEAWGDVSAVINGIDTASVAHPGCRRRMLTGYREAGHADLGAVTGHALSRELPIPYLVLGDSGYVGPLGASVGRVGTTNQLSALIDPEQAYGLPAGAGYSPVVPNEAEAALIRNRVMASAEREQAIRGARGYNRARVNDFISSLERGDRLIAKKDVMQASRRKLTFQNQLDVTVDVLEQGLSRAVMIDGRHAWDTHANLGNQNQFYDELFESLAQLAQTLSGRPGSSAGQTLMDETVIAVMSEMGRTPLINDGGGKDHWPITSALVFGAGVRGGALCGGTDDAMMGVETNMETGQPGAGGAIYPENLNAGLLELVGVDPSVQYPGIVPLRGFHA
jgi:uncharacterized protein (DUF1501 family)